jgi:hypothetical protein
MSHIFRNRTVILRVGLVLAIVSMVIINPAWRAELQAQGYSGDYSQGGINCGERRIIMQQCATTIDSGDLDPNLYPVGGGIILQDTLTCEPGNYWGDWTHEEVGSCDPASFPGQSFDSGECHCP